MLRHNILININSYRHYQLVKRLKMMKIDLIHFQLAFPKLIDVHVPNEMLELEPKISPLVSHIQNAAFFA